MGLALAKALWTTGTFEPDAREDLEYERHQRTRRSIEWRNGKAVRAIALQLKLKAIGDALQEHFLRHPVAKVSSG